jgi:hypothetical protein
MIVGLQAESAWTFETWTRLAAPQLASGAVVPLISQDSTEHIKALKAVKLQVQSQIASVLSTITDVKDVTATLNGRMDGALLAAATDDRKSEAEWLAYSAGNKTQDAKDGCEAPLAGFLTVAECKPFGAYQSYVKATAEYSEVVKDWQAETNSYVAAKAAYYGPGKELDIYLKKKGKYLAADKAFNTAESTSCPVGATGGMCLWHEQGAWAHAADDGVTMGPKWQESCYLAYANTYSGLQGAWCGGSTCTTAGQAAQAKQHYELYYKDGQAGGHRGGANNLTTCLGAAHYIRYGLQGSGKFLGSVAGVGETVSCDVAGFGVENAPPTFPTADLKLCSLGRKCVNDAVAGPICVPDNNVEEEKLTGCTSELSWPVAAFDALIEETVDEGKERHGARRTLLAAMRAPYTLSEFRKRAGTAHRALSGDSEEAGTPDEAAAVTVALETGDHRAAQTVDNGMATKYATKGGMIYAIVSGQTLDMRVGDRYQSPIGQRIKNRHGICLDSTTAGRSTNGVTPHMWACDTNNVNQHWVYNSGTGQIKNSHGTQCLDTTTPGRSAGREAYSVKPHMWACDTNNANQQWEYNLGTGLISAARIGGGRICLDANPRGTNGGSVHMYACQDYNANQQWEIPSGVCREIVDTWGHATSACYGEAVACWNGVSNSKSKIIPCTIPFCTAGQQDHSDGGCPVHKINGGCRNDIRRNWWARCPVTCDRCIPCAAGKHSPAKVKCADEGAVCACTGIVQFGHKDGSSGIMKSASGSMTCSNAEFGSDPVPGMPKACYCTNAVCTNCPAGKHQPLTGQAGCVACAVGKYQGATGSAAACKACPAGKTQPLTGQAACSNCEAGKSGGGSVGSANCLSSAKRQFGNKVTAARNYLVSGGWGHVPPGCSVQSGGDWAAHYNTASGTSHLGAYALVDFCSACAVGQFENVQGSAACKQCAAGQFQGAAGSTACVACGAGKSQSATGQTACNACPIAQYQNAPGQAGCKLCAAGQFNAVTNQAACERCAAGTVPYRSSTSCKPVVGCSSLPMTWTLTASGVTSTGSSGALFSPPMETKTSATCKAVVKVSAGLTATAGITVWARSLPAVALGTLVVEDYELAHTDATCAASSGSAQEVENKVTLEECKDACTADASCKFFEFGKTAAGGICNADRTKCSCTLVNEETCSGTTTPRMKVGGSGSGSACTGTVNNIHGNICLYDDTRCVNKYGQCGILETQVDEICGAWDVRYTIVVSALKLYPTLSHLYCVSE